MKGFRFWLVPFFVLLGAAPQVWSQARLAPGFTELPKGAKVAIMPSDIELFEVGVGAVPEPKAEWTEAATKYFTAALKARYKTYGLATLDVSPAQADEYAELIAVYTAVGRSIMVHHMSGPGVTRLESKDGKLDWSLGESVQPLRNATGADYALFTWVRDGYATAGRAAAMALTAILSRGRVVQGGAQQSAYASLLDLRTGRVLWFNRLQRTSGDLRTEEPATETVKELLKDFPAKQVAETGKPETERPCLTQFECRSQRQPR
jgi:hypothetical protein